MTNTVPENCVVKWVQRPSRVPGCCHAETRSCRTLAQDGMRTIWTRAGNESERQELGGVTGNKNQVVEDSGGNHNE